MCVCVRPYNSQVSFSNNFAKLSFLPGSNCPEVWQLFLADFLVELGNPKAPASREGKRFFDLSASQIHKLKEQVF